MFNSAHGLPVHSVIIKYMLYQIYALLFAERSTTPQTFAAKTYDGHLYHRHVLLKHMIVIYTANVCC